MNSLMYLTIVAFVVYFVIGAYAYNKMKRSKESRLFLSLCISLAIWSFGYIFVYDLSNEFWMKFSAFGWCTFSAIILNIVVTITENKFFKKAYTQLFLYVPALFLLFVRVVLNWDTLKPSMFIYKAYSTVNIVYNIGFQVFGFVLVVLWGINQKTIREKRQAITMLLGSLISFLLNLMSIVKIPYINSELLPSCGQIYSIFMMIGVYYASQRYNFLKISSDILFHEIFEEMMDLFFLISPEGNIIKVNNSALDLLGYSRENIVLLKLEDIFHEKEIVKKIKLNGVFIKERLRLDLNCITFSGKKVPVSVSSSVITDKITKEIIGIVIVGQDRTLVKRLEEEISKHDEIIKKLSESEERFRVMFDKHSSIKLLIEPETLKIYSANEAAQEFYGYTNEDFSNMIVSDLSVRTIDEIKDTIEEIMEKKNPVLYMEHKLSNGERRNVEVHAAPVPFKDKVIIYSIIHDVTERKKAEEKIKYLAYHDNLTGLTNRKYFVEALEKEIISKESRTDYIAVIFIDLNGFKSINDTFGHEAGDFLLCQVGKRFKACVKSKDVVSRFGGDEFALIIYDVKNEIEVDELIKNIYKNMQLPIMMKDKALSIKASIGKSMFPGNEATVDELLNKADKEMYLVKKNTR